MKNTASPWHKLSTVLHPCLYSPFSGHCSGRAVDPRGDPLPGRPLLEERHRQVLEKDGPQVRQTTPPFLGGKFESWNVTFVSSALGDEEKAVLRQKLLQTFEEPVAGIALQIAVLIGKAARWVTWTMPFIHPSRILMSNNWNLYQRILWHQKPGDGFAFSASKLATYFRNPVMDGRCVSVMGFGFSLSAAWLSGRISLKANR